MKLPNLAAAALAAFMPAAAMADPADQPQGNIFADLMNSTHGFFQTRIETLPNGDAALQLYFDKFAAIESMKQAYEMAPYLALTNPDALRMLTALDEVFTTACSRGPQTAHDPLSKLAAGMTISLMRGLGQTVSPEMDAAIRANSSPDAVREAMRKQGQPYISTVTLNCTVGA